MRVVIFVGHKGVGTGATHGNLDEHELAQKAAIAIGCTLMVRGYQPFIVTGEGSDYVEQRIRLAEKEHADVAVSCHFNSVDAQGPDGCEVLYHEDDSEAMALAMLTAPRIANHTGVRLRHESDAGTVPRHNLRLLRYMAHAHLPCVILEPLFLSNAGDRATVQTAGYFLSLSRAVVDALEVWWVATGRGGA